MHKIGTCQLTPQQKREFATFCRAIVKWQETGKNSHYFRNDMGLCPLMARFQIMVKGKKYFSVFTKVFPFDRSFSSFRCDHNKYRESGERMKFVREWAAYGVKKNK